MIKLDRYDPRTDKEALKELFDDFNQNLSYFPVDWDQFENELNRRVLKLQYRNAMIIAREDDKIVGFGTFTAFKDHLGRDHALVHQVMTRKADAFKKGIEFTILEELQKYISRSLNTRKFYYRCPDSDNNWRSLLMKLNQKKSKCIWYEN
ncbi:MAG: hypothetical protein JW891_16345 [Candidatus Lokiarchaeota archaeon]|nr:hypothetical protein [Candidatus Lokiarchaeota archaeon]